MGQKDYLKNNYNYWQKEYFAPNIESFVFRWYGRVLSADFGITGKNGEKLLDFGCGQGAALNYFHDLGFDVYGVDINNSDFQVAVNRYPFLKDKYRLIAPDPADNHSFFDTDFDVVIAIQALHYFSNHDLEECLDGLFKQMRPNSVFYATMMADKSLEYFNNSSEYCDGLRKVEHVFESRGIRVSDYYVNFTYSEEDLVKKFHMFEPVHVGFFSQKYRNDEEQGFSYTFTGVKR